MTLECLPSAVRESLHQIVKDNSFTKNADIVSGDIVTTDISSCLRVTVKEHEKKLCLFVKFLSPEKSKFGEEGLIYFNNEIIFYDLILSQFKQLIRRSNSSNSDNDHLTFAPTCLKIGNGSGEPPFIILLDISAAGYKPLDVKQPLSLECARLILAQLGQFHACSFALKDQRPELFMDATSKLQETVFREDARPTYGKVFIHSIHDVFKLAKQAFPTQSVYVEKFAAFMLNVFDRMCSLAKGDDNGEYNVVTHGDLWINNLLYKRDEKKTEVVESVIFVDFQGCRYTSPVHDLMAIILVGLDRATREEHRDSLIKHYHMSLCQTLQDLGSDPLRLFPYSALQDQLLKHTQFAFSLALVGLPLFLNEGLTAASKAEGGNNIDTLEEFLEEMRGKKSMKCKNMMLELIMDMVDQGYI